jgi:hypothetical protein
MSTVATFEIEYLQFLGPDGRLVRDDLPEFAQDMGSVVELYRQMLLVRSFDTKAIALQRTGKLGTLRQPASARRRSHVGHRRARCVPRTCCARAIASTARSSCAA